MGKTVNAREVLTDINQGMSREQLMEKYGLTSGQVGQLYRKLKEKGLVRQKTVSPRMSARSVGNREAAPKTGQKPAAPQPRPETQPVRTDVSGHLERRQARVMRTILAVAAFYGMLALIAALDGWRYGGVQLTPLIIWALITAALLLAHRLYLRTLSSAHELVAFEPIQTYMNPRLVEMARRPGVLSRVLSIFPGISIRGAFEVNGARRKTLCFLYLDEEMTTDEQGRGILAVNPGRAAWHRTLLSRPAEEVEGESSGSAEGRTSLNWAGLLATGKPLYFAVLVAAAFVGPHLVLGRPRGYVESLVVGFVFAFGAAAVLTGIQFLLKRRGR